MKRAHTQGEGVPRDLQILHDCIAEWEDCENLTEEQKQIVVDAQLSDEVQQASGGTNKLMAFVKVLKPLWGTLLDSYGYLIDGVRLIIHKNKGKWNNDKIRMEYYGALWYAKAEYAQHRRKWIKFFEIVTRARLGPDTPKNFKPSEETTLLGRELRGKQLVIIQQRKKRMVWRELRKRRLAEAKWRCPFVGTEPLDLEEELEEDVEEYNLMGPPSPPIPRNGYSIRDRTLPYKNYTRV